MDEHGWWRGATIYQIYPRSFFDSNGDGIGDLPGITARLGHVAGLGVDAIWLAPFFVSPQADFGYDVADHLAVDPIFGTLADVDALVARAHALGLRVLIDQVWSHTSERHAWFRSSRAGREAPRADWYVWADPLPDGSPPNNWLSVFGGPAWAWEPRRRQYYLHHFLRAQPALNLHNPDVADAVLDCGRFWLEHGVDGFRLDAVDFMLHDPSLAPNPPAPRPAGGVPSKLFGLQRHQFDMMHAGTANLLARIRRLLDDFPGRAALGEISSQPGAFDRLRGYTEGPRHLHMAYTLGPLRGAFDHASVRALVAEAAKPGGWPCWSFSNHDVERAATRWHPRGAAAGHDPDFVRLLMALLLSLRGSALIYEGEELGLPEAVLAEHELRDPFGIAFWPEFRGRDGARTPMPWSAALPHAGFTTGTPWLPVPAAHRALAVEGSALAEDWRQMLALRRGSAALRTGELIPLDLPAPLVGYVREAADERVLCLFNLAESATPLPQSLRAEAGHLPFELPRFGTLLAALTPELQAA